MIKTKKLTWTALGAVLLAAGLTMPTAQAQSADALLDKLVDKGVLSVKEANELREQSDQGYRKAYQSKSGMPDWVTQLKLYGDVRGRYEFFKTDNDDRNLTSPTFDQQNKDRTRLRYRLRVGATVQMKDSFEVGFRLTSSEPNADGTGGDPISGNTTAQNNGSKKFVYIDTAYGKWTPINSGHWLLGTTIGKMDNPFVVSDMVFDGDYTPEGVAVQAGYDINSDHSIRLNSALFILDEINQGSQASNDPLMTGVQVRYDAKWTPVLASTAGVGWYALTQRENLPNGAVPNVNAGNSRRRVAVAGEPTAIAGSLIYDYQPVVIDAAITYTLERFPLNTGPFPIKIAGEWMYNPGASGDNQGMWGGLFLGKAGKKGTWEASYRYKRLEADAWYEEFVDSDFGAYYGRGPGGAAAGGPTTGTSPRSGFGPGYRAGTGIQGHIVKTAYSLSDSFTIGATWFYTSLIDEQRDAAGPAGRKIESGQHRLQVDASWKF